MSPRIVARRGNAGRGGQGGLFGHGGFAEIKASETPSVGALSRTPVQVFEEDAPLLKACRAVNYATFRHAPAANERALPYRKFFSPFIGLRIVPIGADTLPVANADVRGVK
jgi:hypothetical protein